MEPSINTATDVGLAEVGVTAILTTEPCWMDLIIDFLVKDRVPDDKK